MIGSLGAAPSTLRTDVLVVGAGAAGLTLARTLGRAGVDVLVVESGGLLPSDEARALNAAETVGVPHSGIETGRVRAFGGTTRVWPGQLLRLRPSDFERREHVPGSGWPVAAADLDEWYARAETVLGVGGPRDPAAIWREARLGMAPPPGDDLDAVASSLMAKPDLARTLQHEIERSERIRVMLDSTALRLELDEGGRRVARVALGGREGRRATVEPRRVVLAAGGIENPRLLLLSNVGNDFVGRYFHDHPVAETAAVVRTADPRRLQDWFGVFFRRGRRGHVKLALSAAAEARLAVPACSATFVFRAPQGAAADALLRLRRRALGREPLRGAGADAVAAARDVRGVVSALQRRYVRGLSPAPRPTAVELLCIAEQAPERESRISLGGSVDAFGLPRARLNWIVSESERRAIAAMVDAVGGWLARANLGAVEAMPWLAHDDWRGHLHDGFHHMGATRMAADSRSGVVDENCRVHGVENLYLAGSSVFPASGYANPTLTIVALAIRLADHLRARS